MTHKAGFVSIVGRPNVGKSTLMNQLVGERLSIITSKAQTTRHRILGILSGDDFQIVYSDTPGVIEPKYKLQESMMNFVEGALADADVILFVVEIGEKPEETDLVQRIRRSNTPTILVINKIDMADQEKTMEKIAAWQEIFPELKRVLALSALHQFNVEGVLPALLEELPEHAEFFPKDELTDKSQRFFASEIIREKILLNYKEEIPYACEVVIFSFKEVNGILRISAEILVERDSQKAILIGKGGSMLKKVGTEARKDMEVFFGQKVFLEQYVKVEPDWRKKADKLERFGYLS